MHHIKVIKDGNVNNVVKEQLVDGVQYVDNEPHEGSLNVITSDGVAKAVAESVEQSNREMKDMEEMFLVNLPIAANTLRFEFSKMDYNPTVAGVGTSGTWKKVSAKFNNVWDWTKSGTSFSNAFENAFNDSDNLVSLIDAGDTSTITSMYRMFYGCTSVIRISLFNTTNVTTMTHAFNSCSLTDIPLFDTSSVTHMSYAFNFCYKLRNIPLFDTSSVTNMSCAFNHCYNVNGGALALYQQASAQTTPPSNYTDCFKYCGKNTETGAAELAHIPASWGGTAP